jgi:hypothetical protein
MFFKKRYSHKPYAKFYIFTSQLTTVVACIPLQTNIRDLETLEEDVAESEDFSLSLKKEDLLLEYEVDVLVRHNDPSFDNKFVKIDRQMAYTKRREAYLLNEAKRYFVEDYFYRQNFHPKVFYPDGEFKDVARSYVKLTFLKNTDDPEQMTTRDILIRWNGNEEELKNFSNDLDNLFVDKSIELNIDRKYAENEMKSFDRRLDVKFNYDQGVRDVLEMNYAGFLKNTLSENRFQHYFV